MHAVIFRFFFYFST
ncbi:MULTISPECIES: pheST operon leader peptide PheM [Providencia]|nr:MULTISPECIES: pheST operon leader peptide PheM [Providencia]ELR5151965.1 pheST operon leader peptide PheM [Providencia rettgeri]ELR5232371.1 pheST operon leader peptide PheM [Providencia rettgeri]QXX84985.1 pheST operon leader peptide PheM [Providencia sp. R33]